MDTGELAPDSHGIFVGILKIAAIVNQSQAADGAAVITQFDLGSAGIFDLQLFWEAVGLVSFLFCSAISEVRRE